MQVDGGKVPRFPTLPFRTIGVTLIIAACINGCGGSGGNAETVSTSAAAIKGTAAPNASTTSKRSRKAEELLLTLADLPSGFSTPAPTTSTSKKPNDLKCFTFSDKFRKRDGAKAEAKFSGQGQFQEVNHLVAVASEVDAKGAFQDIKSGLAAPCSETTKTADGVELTYELQPLSFAKFGDETFAARIKIKASFLTVDADLVIFRAGQVVEMVYGISVPPEKLETIVRAAANKL